MTSVLFLNYESKRKKEDNNKNIRTSKMSENKQKGEKSKVNLRVMLKNKYIDIRKGPIYFDNMSSSRATVHQSTIIES